MLVAVRTDTERVGWSGLEMAREEEGEEEEKKGVSLCLRVVGNFKSFCAESVPLQAS